MKQTVGDRSNPHLSRSGPRSLPGCSSLAFSLAPLESSA